MSRFLSIAGLFLVAIPLEAGERSLPYYETVAWIQEGKLVLVETKPSPFCIIYSAERAGAPDLIEFTIRIGWEPRRKENLDRTQFSLYGVDGKPIDERTYRKLLKEVQPVILCENQLMEEKKRKLLKEGMLILVRKTK